MITIWHLFYLSGSRSVSLLWLGKCGATAQVAASDQDTENAKKEVAVKNVKYIKKFKIWLFKNFQ